MQTNVKTATHRLTLAAVFMAMNIALSSFGLPVPGGHLYLNDVVICLAALLLGPFEAFAVGGIGAFLGDLFFYPTPMFVSLVTHGVQAIVISLIAHKALKEKPVAASILAVTVGAIIMIVGYTLGRAYIYATPETALLKLPYQIMQAALGAVIGTLLYWTTGIKTWFDRYIAGESI